MAVAPVGVCTSASSRFTPPLADSDRSLGVSSREDHCGPCVDVPVLVNAIGPGVSPLVFPETYPAPFLGMAPDSLAGSSMPGMQTALLHPGIRLDLPDPTSISLRNTVLLI